MSNKIAKNGIKGSGVDGVSAPAFVEQCMSMTQRTLPLRGFPEICVQKRRSLALLYTASTVMAVAFLSSRVLARGQGASLLLRLLGR